MNTHMSKPKIRTSSIRNSLAETVVFMLITATFSAVVSALIWFFTIINVVPFGYIFVVVTLPFILANLSLYVTIAIFGVPLFGGIFGWLFAKNVAGGVGSFAVNYGVRLLGEGDGIYDRVQAMAKELDLPPVKWVGWYEEPQINAFACGIEQAEAMLIFTSGAIKKTTPEQFEAIIGHELGHIANNDMQRMTYAHGIQQGLSWFLIFRGLKNLVRWLFTPLSEMLVMRMSREREYYADAIGAYLTSPEAMAGVLETIEKNKGLPTKPYKDFAKFMLKADDFGLFRTHPPTSQRIQALQKGTYIQRLPLEKVLMNEKPAQKSRYLI